MQVVLAQRWAEELGRAAGIGVHVMHPGWVDTPGVRDSLPRFRMLTRPILRTPDEGADTMVWLLAEPDLDPADGRLLDGPTVRGRPTSWAGTRRPRRTASGSGSSAARPSRRTATVPV